MNLDYELKGIIDTFFVSHPAPLNLSPVDAATHYQTMEIEMTDELWGSYMSLGDVLTAQYDALRGIGIEFLFESGEPHNSSRSMFAEIAQRRLTVRKSLGDDYTDIDPDHPMAMWVLTVDGRMLLNDVFRAVHDVLGHYAIRASIGQDGEAMAWLHHRSLLPRSTHQALWCETRGQNTWTNFWANHQSLPNRERPFAVQKFGTIPGEFV